MSDLERLSQTVKENYPAAVQHVRNEFIKGAWKGKGYATFSEYMMAKSGFPEDMRFVIESMVEQAINPVN